MCDKFILKGRKCYLVPSFCCLEEIHKLIVHIHLLQTSWNYEEIKKKYQNIIWKIYGSCWRKAFPWKEVLVLIKVHSRIFLQKKATKKAFRSLDIVLYCIVYYTEAKILTSHITKRDFFFKIFLLKNEALVFL